MEQEPHTFSFILSHKSELEQYIADEVEKERKAAKGGKRRLRTAKSRKQKEDSE